MSSDYSYDTEGQFFPFFVLTLAGLVTVPLTYTLLRPSREDEQLAPRIKSDYEVDHGDIIKSLQSARKKKQRRIVRILVVIAGWALMGGMGYLIMNTEVIVAKLWNPYDILGISESLTEKQIKSHYKKLSIKFHPDKVRPDASKNETVESLNSHYVELTKAYQALTDEEVRNNYIQYGHPDGKQSFSMGIALPTFLISDANGKYVVLLYTGLLGVLLPYLVGSWWYGTQRMSKEGVLMESANSLFRQYDENLDENGIVAALSDGKEYEEILKGDQADSGIAKVETQISAPGQVSKFAAGFSVEDKHKFEDMETGRRRKVLGLLWAYLGRVDLGDAALNRAKYEVGPVARLLNQSMFAISLAWGNLPPLVASFRAGQHLIQAVSPKASPLLQLPHFTPAIAKAANGDSRANVSVQKFMDRPDAERRGLVVGKNLLTDSEYKTAMAVGKQLPFLRVEKAFFKVTGEKVIIPSSLVTIVVKGRFIPPGTEKVPKMNETDLEDIDPSEDDLEAMLGRKKIIKGPDGKPMSVKQDETFLPPLTHAPLYSSEETPKWHVFLSDAKQEKIAVPPFTFAKFDQPIFDDQGKPTFNVQTLKAQFAAPGQAGTYSFKIHIICDSYIGFDTRLDIALVVEEASKVEEIAAEDEISEPEEDSIAGTMQALKTGEVPKPKKRVQKDDSEDESGTEEEEDDTSDTNTDTEDEGS